MAFARANFAVTDDDGNVVDGCTIEVRHEISGQPLAALKANRDGTPPHMTNPFVAADGSNAGFYVATGPYQIRAYLGPSGAPTFERIFRYEPILTGEETLVAVESFKGLIVAKSGDYLYVRDRWDGTYDKVETFFLGSAGSDSAAGTAGPSTVKLIPASVLEGATAIHTETSFDLVSVTADDAAPIWINGLALGGNHGYIGYKVTATTHGKTNVDIGSKWTDGASKVWVLAGIPDANNLVFVEFPGGTATAWTITLVLTGTTFTHSLGATHTGSITFSSPVSWQLWPYIQDQVVRVVLDGSVIVEEDGTYSASSVSVTQSYGIPNARSVVDALVAAVGSSSAPVYNDTATQTQVEIDIVYSWRAGEMMTVDYSYKNEQAYASYHAVAMQAGPIERGSDNLFLFVPRTTTEATRSLDFSTPQNITTLGATTNFDTAEWADANDPPERFAFIRRTGGGTPVRGFLMGYSHMIGEGVPSRRAAAIAVALQLFSTNKLYPYFIDTTAGASSAAGDFRKVTGYRGYFDGSVNANVTSQGIYTVGNKQFWVFDTKATLTNAWVLPPYAALPGLLGKPISVMGNGKKSSTLTLSSEFISDRGVLITTTSGGGWMIAEIGGASNPLGRLDLGLSGTYAGTIRAFNTTAGANYNDVLPQAGPIGVVTNYWPTYGGILVTRTGTDTLTNKSINASNNTISNLTLAMLAANVADTDGTLATNSDARVATQKATKTYVDGIVAANDAMVFKGVIDCSANPNYPAADRGHTYRVSVAGKIGGASGTNVEVGDILLCLTDSTASGTQAGVGASWSIIQVNIDGAVVGPASSTDGHLALFNGPTGKILKDSTLSDLLDAAIGSTRGMMLLRGASSWGSLAVGSANQVLTSNGTDPAWATRGGGAARNSAVNGAVDVSQELGTTGATLANNTAKYTADMWEAMYNHGAATAVVTSGQVALPVVLAGFDFGHQVKATTAITSPASGDFAKHRQKIEGHCVAKWGWGATGAASIVVAFNLYSTASGTAFVRLSNSAGNRFYYHEITVAAGWNFYAFSVPGDTSGTWLKTSGIGVVFEVFVSGKETTPQSSLDAWGATAKVQTTNSTNLLGTANNLTILTGLYLDIGTQLPVVTDMPGLMRTFDDEYDLCRRYWEKSYNYATAPGTASQTAGLVTVLYPSLTYPNNTDTPSVGFLMSKRVTPTMTCYSYLGTQGDIGTQGGTDRAASAGIPAVIGETCFSNRNQSGGNVTLVGYIIYFHFVADARM